MEAKRRLGNWLTGWQEFTDTLPSPSLWRLWGGIGILAAALERKVWVRTNQGPLYPNLYIVICGPPGLGKTAVTSQVWTFLNSLSDGTDKGLHIASSSVTFASVVDELAEAKRDIVRLDMEPNRYEFNSLAIVSNELGVLLPEYDVIMMPKLTDIYDGHPYSERRRTRDKKDRIDNPQLNLIAACTPGYLTQMLPPGAWDQGFLSRTLIAFSTEALQRDIFGETKTAVELRATLIEDLRTIFKSDFTFGPMTFDVTATAKLEAWNRAGGPPRPEHPKLMHYITRRTAHLIKLCMIASIAESSRGIINEEHLATALSWLLELEIYMGDIFKAMVVGGDGQAMSETWYHFAAMYGKKPEPIPEYRWVEFLAQRLPAHSVVRVLDVMERAGLIKKVFVGSAGSAYVPQQKRTS